MASVTLFNTLDQNVLPGGAMETPKVHLEVPVTCAYERSMLISADFSSMGYRLCVAVSVCFAMFTFRASSDIYKQIL